MILVFSGLGQGPTLTAQETNPSSGTPLRGALIVPTEVSGTRLMELQTDGINTIVFQLSSSSDEAKKECSHRSSEFTAGGARVCHTGSKLLARQELAHEHPEWMASLQTHDEWRRLFPEARQPKPTEVVKTYPWVPILSREPFMAQRERVLELLASLPTPKLIFLNDLQGAPSACGCGNPLCRWTSDYGERRSTTPLGDDAAALFVEGNSDRFGQCGSRSGMVHRMRRTRWQRRWTMCWGWLFQRNLLESAYSATDARGRNEPETGGFGTLQGISA